LNNYRNGENEENNDNKCNASADTEKNNASIAVMESRDTCLVLRHVSRLETWFSCLGLGSVSTLVCLVLDRRSSFYISSCLMSRDCVDSWKTRWSWLCLDYVYVRHS